MVQIKTTQTVRYHRIHINRIQCLENNGYAVNRIILHIRHSPMDQTILSHHHPVTTNQDKYHIVKYSFHIRLLYQFLYCKEKRLCQETMLSLAYEVLFSLIAHYPNKEKLDNNTGNRLIYNY